MSVNHTIVSSPVWRFFGLLAIVATAVIAKEGGGLRNGQRRRTEYESPTCPDKPGTFGSCNGLPSPCNDPYLGLSCCTCDGLPEGGQLCSYGPCGPLPPTTPPTPAPTVAPTPVPTAAPTMPQCPAYEFGTFSSCDGKPSPCLNLEGENKVFYCKCEYGLCTYCTGDECNY